MSASGMGVLTPEIVDYCAQECAWQESGELSVGWMVHAWEYAFDCRDRPISVNHIRKLGSIIEPEKNVDGFRKQPVWVGRNEKMPWPLIEDAVDLLTKRHRAYIQAVHPADEEFATAWFREYEDIHPFVDGNGRTGTLLYNWLLGTLDRPVHVPNLWNDPRR